MNSRNIARVDGRNPSSLCMVVNASHAFPGETKHPRLFTSQKPGMALESALASASASMIVMIILSTKGEKNLYNEVS
jgi:hypothetical protein